MEDERIIELFFQRSDQAIRELDDKYGKICRALSQNILGDPSDAEECVSDAYLGAWNAIPPAKPDPLRAYLCKIVRNISLNRYERKKAAKRGSSYEIAMEELEATLSSPDTVEEEIEARELARVIEDFLATLPLENRVIFMLRYAYAEPYSRIAQRVGLTEDNVSVRLTRIRQRMKRYFLEREVLV